MKIREELYVRCKASRSVCRSYFVLFSHLTLQRDEATPRVVEASSTVEPADYPKSHNALYVRI
jgi:hypothetical protein